MTQGEELTNYLKIHNHLDCPSLEKLVYHNGQLLELDIFTKAVIPPYLTTKQECFRNAFELARLLDADYYEGFAVITGVPLAILHGWCVREGKIVDPTWHHYFQNGDTASYYGIHFPMELATMAILDTEHYGILGMGHRMSGGLRKKIFTIQENVV